jgi:ketosteroid isomerase-like protein
MKRLIINAIAICLFALISVGTFAQSKEEMKVIVAKMNQEMIDLVKAGRYEAMSKYYDENAISLPNYRAMEKGYKLILNNNLGRKQGGYKILDGQKTTVELFVGEDMMVDIGSYTLTMDFPGLPQPKVDNGKYMNVWKKDAQGAWRIIAETWNADKSPNPPPQSKGSVSEGMGSPTKSNPGTGTEQKPAIDTKDGKK